MMTYILVSLCFSLLSGVPQQQACSCGTRAKDKEKTHWTTDHQVVHILNEEIIATLQGRVDSPDGEPVPSILVEIYNVPDDESKTYGLSEEAYGFTPEQIEQIEAHDRMRIAACHTGKDGRFCFKGIPPGVYEVRISKTEFITSSRYVRVAGSDQHTTTSALYLSFERAHH